MKILDGKIVADKIIKNLETDVDNLKAKEITPHLAAISIGDNQASQKYLSAKQARVEGLGFEFNLYEFLPIATSNQIEELIEQLNNCHSVDGILVQLPLPHSLSQERILAKIDPQKDIDNLTKKSKFVSPTAMAIFEILRFYKIPLSGKKVVIVGRGKLVGKPFADLAKASGAKVIAVDNQSANLKETVKSAEILVTGAGHPQLITAEMVNENSIVIDAGVFVEAGRQKGDVDFPAVTKIVKAITPSTGGVGPVTIACLIKNLVMAAKNRLKIS